MRTQSLDHLKMSWFPTSYRILKWRSCSGWTSISAIGNNQATEANSSYHQCHKSDDHGPGPKQPPFWECTVYCEERHPTGSSQNKDGNVLNWVWPVGWPTLEQLPTSSSLYENIPASMLRLYAWNHIYVLNLWLSDPGAADHLSVMSESGGPVSKICLFLS